MSGFPRWIQQARDLDNQRSVASIMRNLPLLSPCQNGERENSTEVDSGRASVRGGELPDGADSPCRLAIGGARR